MNQNLAEIFQKKQKQSLGVDPQQFRSDFQAAVQAAQGGSVNASTAFGSLPPGSVVDTTG